MADGLALIKGRMPQTYKLVQDRAMRMGKQVFALVRRGLRGEANCFWAMEAGYVVGTPFKDQEVERDIAQLMVQFGAVHVVIWGRQDAQGQAGAPVQGGNHGTD